MPEMDVEIVRRAFEARYRRPDPDFATVNAIFSPEHEFISRIEALEGGSRRGLRGYREWEKEMAETVDWESTFESAREIDDGRILVVLPTRLRGKQSGLEVDNQRLGAIVTVRDGTIVRTEVHSSPDAALEAAGEEK
jgi:ketosteroid isomerase-like protein